MEGPFSRGRDHACSDGVVARARASSCPAAISLDLTGAQDASTTTIRGSAHRPDFTWPPQVDWVNRYGIAAVGILAVPAVVATWLAGRPDQSQSQQEWHGEELKRRTRKLSDLTRRAEAALETSRSGHATVWVRFSDLLEASQKVAQLDVSEPCLMPGLLAAAAALEHELPEVTQGTERTLQTSISKRPAEALTSAESSHFQDGSALANLLREHLQLRACVQSCWQSMQQQPETAAKMRQSLNNLQHLALEGDRVRRTMRNQDFGKAVRLVWLARQHLPVIAVSSVLSALLGVLRTTELYYRMLTIEVFRNPAWTWDTFRRTGLAMMLTKMVTILTSIVQARVQDAGDRGVANTLKTEMYGALLRQDFEWYKLGQKDQRNIDELFNDVFLLPGNVKSLLDTPRKLVDMMVEIISQVSIIRSRSSALLYALLAVHWSNSSISAGLTSLKNHFTRRIKDTTSEPEPLSLIEPIRPEYLPMLRSFAAEDKATSNWRAYLENDSRVDQITRAMQQAFQPLEQSLKEGFDFVELGWSGRLIKAKQMDVADMQSLTGYAKGMSESIQKVPNQIQEMRDELRPLAKAWDLLALQPKIGLAGGKLPLDASGKPARAQGHLAFEGVEFAYPGGELILRGVTFEVKAGSTIGITGTSGGGKSTLLRLLERFYDPSAGRITLDGEDIRSYNPQWLRRQFALVSQHIRLFSMSLWENLTLGCVLEPSLGAVEQACRAAQIWEELILDAHRLPNGLYTHVSGEIFSGGELQRLAIARAILIDAPVLLLDEATSALDSESQRRFQQALSQLERGRTVLSVAHRLETIRGADKIVCLHAGRVAEEGTHEMLANHRVTTSVHFPSVEAFKKEVELSPAGDINDDLVGSAGAVVVRLKPGGLAESAGIRIGFRVTQHDPCNTVHFEGLGVYAELQRQQHELPTPNRTASEPPRILADVLEQLHRTRLDIAALVASDDAGGIENNLQQVLKDFDETLHALEQHRLVEQGPNGEKAAQSNASPRSRL